MKKLSRTLVCIAMLAILLCTSAMAADSGISIRFNGESLTFTDAAPQITNDRTCLPFRSVFTALGFEDENITWNNETRTVKATKPDVLYTSFQGTEKRGDMNVELTIGANSFTVWYEGNTTADSHGNQAQVAEDYQTEAAPYIDPASNRTYIPAALVADALGYRVGWDAKTRTVIIDDVDAILAANTETYAVLEKYLDYGRKYQEKNAQVAGAYSADMTAAGETMKMDGTYDMLMAGNTTFDFDMLMKFSGVVGGEDLAAALPEGVDFQMRGDMAKGVFYFKSDALMSLMETGTQNLWFKIDLAALMDQMAAQTGVSYAELMTMSQDMLKDLDGKAYVELMVNMMAEADPTSSVVDQLALFNAMLGDSAFTKTSDGYAAEFDLEGVKMTMKFFTSGDKIVGYAITMGAEAEGMKMAMDISMKDDKMTAVFNMDMAGEMTMEMTMDGTYTTTTKAPAGAPSEEAAVMDLMEMMGQMQAA